MTTIDRNIIGDRIYSEENLIHGINELIIRLRNADMVELEVKNGKTASASIKGLVGGVERDFEINIFGKGYQHSYFKGFNSSSPIDNMAAYTTMYIREMNTPNVRSIGLRTEKGKIVIYHSADRANDFAFPPEQADSGNDLKIEAAADNGASIVNDCLEALANPAVTHPEG